MFREKTISYCVKDIKWKETKGKEMANALMVVCDENNNQIETFAIYDEKYKVMYAMSDDALRWYEDYLSKKEWEVNIWL